MQGIETIHSVPNAVSRYYSAVHRAAGRLDEAPRARRWFEPGWSLPELTPAMEDFFSATAISIADMGEYRGRRLHLLDLTGNVGTRTTKTFGSSLIVARAIRHIELTGEPVLLATASAANKAVALRDAVLRAYRSGIADPARLRVVAGGPGRSVAKPS